MVELAAVLMSVALLVYATSRSRLKSRILDHGGLLVAAGLSLAIFAHASDTGIQLVGPFGADESGTSVLALLSIERVHTLVSLAGFSMVALGLFFAIRKRGSAEAEILDTRRELEVSKYFEYQAEERFRYLFDSTYNAVYCFRFDPPLAVDLPFDEQLRRSHEAVLQDCNVIFARELEADDPSEVIGSRFGDLDSAKDTATHEPFFRAFVENDYRLENYNLGQANRDPCRSIWWASFAAVCCTVCGR